MDLQTVCIILACEAGYLPTPIAARRLKVPIGTFLAMRRELIQRALVTIRLPRLADMRTTAELTYRGDKIA